jgi:hypothetical protein
LRGIVILVSENEKNVNLKRKERPADVCFSIELSWEKAYNKQLSNTRFKSEREGIYDSK